MTREHILAQITYARMAHAMGNCDKALGHMQLAWDDLQAFSQQLAAAGKSQSPAVKLHKLVAKVYAVVRRRCHGEALIAPSFQPGARSGGDLIAPSFTTSTTHHPDLLAPSFSGPMLVEGDVGSKPWMGLAVIGVVVATGLWMASQSSR